MQKSVPMKKDDIPWKGAKAEFSPLTKEVGPPATTYGRKALMAFYTAETASKALHALLSNGVSSVLPAPVLEELKKSCEVLPHMATNLLLTYRAKLEEYGMAPKEVALYLDSSGIGKPVPTIKLMFVVMDDNGTQEKMKKLGPMMMNELVKELRTEISANCSVAGIDNRFQIVGHDFSCSTVDNKCIPLGTL